VDSAKKDAVLDQIMQAEDRETGKVSWEVYLIYIREIGGWGVFLLLFLIMLIF
jgi:hypothetical protein